MRPRSTAIEGIEATCLATAYAKVPHQQHMKRKEMEPPSTAPAAENVPTTASDVAKAGKLPDLSGFRFERVLNEDAATKWIAALGRFEGAEEQRAIVMLARRHIDKAALGPLLSSAQLTPTVLNDVYSKYTATVAPEHALLAMDITYPATDKHIAKFLEQPRHMVHETPALYHAVTLPYIQSIDPARISWVYNILEKKKEVDRMLFEDPDPGTGFMLHPDFKWDQSLKDQLYCLGLVLRRDVRSLRDLRAEHLPLLKNLLAKGTQALHDKYGVAPDSLRVYLHYSPSYYHLHVHFCHVDRKDYGAAVGKAILLSDIIDNIETFGSDYYARKTLCIVVGEEEELWRRLQAHTSSLQPTPAPDVAAPAATALTTAPNAAPPTAAQ